jgi:hypothetical protein
MMKVAGFLVFAPLLVALLSFAVMLLWNALIPVLFSGPVLTFWQAAGLLVLCRLLFGGFRPHHHGHHRWRHRAWRDRWHRMSPEDRDRFRDGFRRWKDGPCGHPMRDEPPGMHGEQGRDESRGV